MGKPNFIPGQQVKLNLERLKQLGLGYLAAKYGNKPFEIIKIEDLKQGHTWYDEHPQWVKIKTLESIAEENAEPEHTNDDEEKKTGKGEIQISAVFILPA